MKDSGKPYKLLVIGGSAGSLSMVLKLIPLLKKGMNISVIVVFHRKQSDDATLIEIMSRRTEFHVKEAEDKDDITPGTIYLAPADYHLLIEKNRSLTLDDSEKINYSRPSIDVTFESAADVFTDGFACVLLSGANADGVAGLKEAKASGALIAIQEPSSAEVPFMPEQALANVDPDIVINDKNFFTLIDILLQR